MNCLCVGLFISKLLVEEQSVLAGTQGRPHNSACSGVDLAKTLVGHIIVNYSCPVFMK